MFIIVLITEFDVINKTAKITSKFIAIYLKFI